MNVNVLDHQSDLSIQISKVKLLVPEVICLEGQNCDEVSVYFVNTAEICDLHARFFDDPTTTDCISFPMDDDEEVYRVLGDVFVCPKTAIEYADAKKLDPYEEVTLYIVHGVLHLMGYDDIDTDDRVLMRETERKHIANLRKKGLILNKEETCC